MIKYRVLNAKENGAVIGYAIKTNDGYVLKVLDKKETYHLIYKENERYFTVYKNNFTNKFVRKVGKAWNPKKDELRIKIQLGEGKRAYIDIFAEPFEISLIKEVAA